jgi:hypothetical protein
MITAEELYFNQFGRKPTWDELFVIKEFAKLHVEEALKATAIMGKETWDWTTEECNSITEDAYPLDQIK